MQHPSNDSDIFVIALANYADTVGNHPDSSLESESDGVVVFKVPQSSPLLRQLLEMGIPRLMDKFYLFGGSDSDSDHQLVTDYLFDHYAADYESFIDISLNVDNIRLLLGVVSSLCPVGSQTELIADFGCGSGLSMYAAKESSSALRGIDRSYAMRELARKRGMTVWSVDELMKQPANSVSAAISSYVMHLRPDRRSIMALWSKMCNGAPLVANFHKGLGLTHLLSILGESKVPPNVREVRLEMKSQGPVYVFTKNR